MLQMGRNHPFWVHLRVRNEHSVAEIRRAMQKTEKAREYFVKRLRRQPHHRLVAIAGDWDWSAIQCLRYLVFIEELYIDRCVLQNDEPFSRLGLRLDGLEGPQYEVVGTEPTEDLEAVLTAWERVHGRTKQVMETLTEEVLRISTKRRALGQLDVGEVLHWLMHESLLYMGAALFVLDDVKQGCRPAQAGPDGQAGRRCGHPGSTYLGTFLWPQACPAGSRGAARPPIC